MSSNLLKYVICFIAGGGIGTGITYYAGKRKFSEIVDAEVNRQVKEIRKDIEAGYERKAERHEKSDRQETKDDSSENSETAEKAKQNREKPDLIARAKEIAAEKAHTNYNRKSEEPEEPETDHELEIHIPDPDDIEVIAPEEFGEYGNYEELTLYYLRDGSLVYESGQIVDDPDRLIGYESLNQIGEYDEPDSVYVRNNREHMDIAVYYRENETLENFSG